MRPVWYEWPVEDSDVSRVRSGRLLDALAEAGLGSRFETATPKQIAKVLAEVPLFGSLGASDRRRVAERAEIAHVKADERIVREGFSAEGFFVLLSGSARVEQDRVPVARLERGDAFGELGLLSGKPRTATVIAGCDLWILRIRRDRFRQVLESKPAIAIGLLETLTERLLAAEGRSAPPTTG
jgi:putative ABC transport system ATP-binding protein